MARFLLWRCSVVSLGLAVFPLSGQQASPENFTPDQIRFFETEVSPLFQTNCMVCHSEKLRTSGLSLTSREAILTGGNRGPAVTPGQAEASLLVKAVGYAGDLKMPPTGKLPDVEIQKLARWVEMGAPWTATEISEGGGKRTPSEHWAFQPVKRYSEPYVKNAGWVRNPIDRFVLARLDKKGLTPSPEADRATLIRRLSLDLLGLVPSPADVEAFVSDTRPDAYERLVEHFLASPHYGERWGRHWLDLAHYADSNGYNIDAPREMWMYRDWVINAFNRDLPFDRFVIEQVAGDLLPNPTKDQVVATGFYRNTLLNLEGGIDFEQYRVEAVVDRVDTTGAAFLGLTLGCARCHDHKFDPITQREFYEFYAFFNNVDELSGAHGEEGRKTAHEPLLEFGAPEEFTRRDAIRGQFALLKKELEEYEAAFLARQPEWEKALTAEEKENLKPEVREILGVPAGERNKFQEEALTRVFENSDPGYAARQAGIRALTRAEPKLKSAMVMRELPEPREAFVHLGGDFLRKGIPVKAATPHVLPPLETNGRATRLDLARWLVDPKKPLTTRVTVNRLWQRYFGQGLVSTENDFGTQGSPPSHPELLDWLASEFVARGWSLKAMHRLIVNSATYRQASKHRPEVSEADPENRLLARQNRLRLDAEIVRDAALSASGLLASKIGGPSVFPPQPEGAGRVTQIDREWTADQDADRYRRGMYTYFWRSAPHPGLMVFDAPDSMTACTRRNRSNTPLQALTLLNDKAFYEFAQGLAQRVLKESPESNPERISYAFQICLSRPPKPEEQASLERFLNVQIDDFQTHPEEAKLAIPGDAPAGAGGPQLAAWSAVSRVLLNLDEFITRE